MSPDDTTKRVSVLEREVASVKSDVHHIRADVTAVRDAITALSSQLTSAAKPNFAAWASWAGVLVAAAVYFQQINITPIRDYIVEEKRNAERALERLEDVEKISIKNEERSKSNQRSLESRTADRWTKEDQIHYSGVVANEIARLEALTIDHIQRDCELGDLGK